MDFATITSVTINILLIAAFIIDRLYRLKSLSEYKDAKEAQIATLKERIDFLTTHNDDFLVNKFKSQISDLKGLIKDNEDKPEIEKQLIQYHESTLLLELENSQQKEKLEASEKLNEKYSYALTTIYDVFNLVMAKIAEAKQWGIIKPIHKEISDKLATIKLESED